MDIAVFALFAFQFRWGRNPLWEAAWARATRPLSSPLVCPLCSSRRKKKLFLEEVDSKKNLTARLFAQSLNPSPFSKLFKDRAKEFASCTRCVYKKALSLSNFIFKNLRSIPLRFVPFRIVKTTPQRRIYQVFARFLSNNYFTTDNREQRRSSTVD